MPKLELASKLRDMFNGLAEGEKQARARGGARATRAAWLHARESQKYEVRFQRALAYAAHTEELAKLFDQRYVACAHRLSLARASDRRCRRKLDAAAAVREASTKRAGGDGIGGSDDDGDAGGKGSASRKAPVKPAASAAAASDKVRAGRA